MTRIVAPAGAKAAGKQLAEGVVLDQDGVDERGVITDTGPA